MGYYTEYKLEVIPKEKQENIIKQLKSTNDSADWCLNDDGSTNDYGKWYDAEKELTEFSKKFPELIFILSGIGEEHNDFWKVVIKNGRYFASKGFVAYQKINTLNAIEIGITDPCLIDKINKHLK